MKKLLLPIIGLLLGGLTALGQINMNVGSKLELVPDDADATSYYRQTDVNDNVCAIIKVVPDNSLSGTLILQTKGGMAPVPPPRGSSNFRQESGEWWYWVSPKVTNIMFTCEGYTPTDWMGVSLKPGKVYRLKLNVDASMTIVKTYSGSGLVGVQMTIDPPQARVSYGLSKNEVIDFKSVTDGYYDAFIAEGKYWFEVESKFYETWASEVQVKKGMKEIKVQLKPAYNTFNIFCDPEGTEVYVDGEYLGKTPIDQSAKISKGEHTFTFRKENHYVTNTTETVPGDGSLLYRKVRLKPQFGVVTLLCEDPLADIIVTDPSGKEVFRGKSGSKTQLNSQLTYKVEASRPSHIPQSRGLSGPTIEGKTVEISVDAPVPMYGELQISSNPSRAEVWIDGERAGNTIFSQTILIGQHSVELRKDGYDPLTFTVDIKRDQTTQLSKELKLKTAQQQAKPKQAGASSGMENGHEWVDLGLSVKWATCNVGASKPSDYGNLYAWGETSPKSEYTWVNYKFRTRGDSWDNVKLSKYVKDSKYGSVDNLTSLSLSDDAARYNWGGNWRMPTKEELLELFDKCTYTWTTQDGVNGYLFTSKANGKTIFLPAAGYNNYSSTKGRELEYWSSTLYSSYDAISLTNWTGTFQGDYDLFRFFGMSVRPVIDGEVKSNAETERRKVANTTYVDLGLSVKWATCNVGAQIPEEYGNYYAWGETANNYNSSGNYNWTHYIYTASGTKDDDVQFSRYNTDVSKGLRDNMYRLIREDDAAWIGIAEGWRLPTKAELEELQTKCTWTWKTSNGVKGYKVTGPNGNSIFLPASGYKSGTTGGQEAEYGYFWSSEIDKNAPQNAYYLFCSQEKKGVAGDKRYYGFSVRPVYAYYKSFIADGDWKQRMLKLLENPSYYYGNGRYRGQLNNGRNGFGVYWWKEDGDFYAGVYKDGNREGKGIYMISQEAPRCVNECSDCAFYVGDWSNNDKSGYGACYDRNGKLLYYGRFVNSKPVGKYPDPNADSSRSFVCIKYDNGSTYIGEYKDGKRHGLGIYIWKENSFWIGPWENGERKGKGLYMNSSNGITTGRWEGDTRHDY